MVSALRLLPLRCSSRADRDEHRPAREREHSVRGRVARIDRRAFFFFDFGFELPFFFAMLLTLGLGFCAFGFGALLRGARRGGARLATVATSAPFATSCGRPPSSDGVVRGRRAVSPREPSPRAQRRGGDATADRPWEPGEPVLLRLGAGELAEDVVERRIDLPVCWSCVRARSSVEPRIDVVRKLRPSTSIVSRWMK